MIVSSFIFKGFASPVKDAVSYIVMPVTKGMNNKKSES